MDSDDELDGFGGPLVDPLSIEELPEPRWEMEKPGTCCEPLTISYTDPTRKTKVTEEVFVDPRDSWCDAANVLLVGAKALEAMQQTLERDLINSQGAESMVRTCRRDYLREHQYLLDQLQRLQDQVPAGAAAEVRSAIAGAVKSRASAASGAHAVVAPDEAASIAAAVGPRGPEDAEREKFLRLAGLTTKNDLSMRMLLKEIRGACASLEEERARLRKILAPIDGGGKVVDAILVAAEHAGASLGDVVEAVRDSQKSQEMVKKVEDAITDNLADRYATLLDERSKLIPKVEQWREQLFVEETQAKRICRLEAEVEDQEAQWKMEEALEEAKSRQMNDPAALLASISGNLDADEKQRLEELQSEFESMKRLRTTLQGRLDNLESEYQASEDARRLMRERVVRAEAELTDAEATAQSGEDELESQLQAEHTVRDLYEEAVHAREHCQDEVKAAKAPPPKAQDLTKIESEVAAARERNEALKEKEEMLRRKQELYAERVDNAQNAWLAAEEEAAARRFYEELAEQEAKQGGKRVEGERELDGDPLLWSYPERLHHQSHLTQPRHVNLHTDLRARARRLRKMQDEVLQDYEHQELSRSWPEKDIAKAKEDQLPGAHVPPTFRRQEDLRVRLSGIVKQVDQDTVKLHQQEEFVHALGTELAMLGRQLTACAVELHKLHGKARRGLRALARTDDAQLAAELSEALARHGAAEAEACEALHLSEVACQEGQSENELVIQEGEFVNIEDNLRGSVRGLLGAVAGVSDEVAACRGDLEMLEPQLAVAVAERRDTWSRVLSTAAQLDRQRYQQSRHRHCVRDAARRMHLLDSEIRAAPEVRPALATMRAALTSGQLPPEEDGRRKLLGDEHMLA